MAFKKPFRAVPIEVGHVYREKAKAEARRQTIKTVAIGLSTFLTGFAAFLAFLTWSPATGEASAQSPQFKVCGMIRRTCVVDGDTIWLSGVKIRIADIDTPEISEPKCQSEYALGIRARDRLQELLNEGPFEVLPIGNRDEDQYGRKLRVLVRSGRSLGDQLVSEGLARTWTGRREPWC